jgi:methionine-S-sulfoxide reductase
MEPDNYHIELATFAGGCFWCMVQPFLELDGVIKVIAGYTGGNINNPTYEEVCMGKSGHYEAVQISYNCSKIDFNELLDIFLRQIDPQIPKGNLPIGYINTKLPFFIIIMSKKYLHKIF